MNERKASVRILSFLLVLCMFVGMLPMGVFAEEPTETTDTSVTTEATEAADGTEATEATGEAETTEPSREDPLPTEETEASEPESDPEDEEEVAPLAEEGVTYVLACSDFQAASDSAGQTIVNNILTQIKKDYPTMNGFLCSGDYTVNLPGSVSETTSGKNALQQTIQSVYGTTMNEIYVQGNHDPDDTVGKVLSSSGAHDTADYGVYVINEKDYMWFNNEEATIKSTAAALETYLNAKRNAGYTKPIFVMSHLPLHYCMRTRTSGNGDGKYANYIFDVLNEAGNAGLNIIFMFGHNHSNGWDDYLGGAAIYLTKGNKINIAQASTTNFKEETLAFTYLNAGYVGYYGTTYTSSVDKTLTMTVFAISDDEVTVNRYDANGKHLLKNSGVYNAAKAEYSDVGIYDLDTTTVSSPQTITLNKTVTPADTTEENPGNGSGEDDSVETVVGDWVEITAATNGKVTYTLDTDGIDAGEKYLIVNTNSGTGYVLTNNNGSIGATSVTISNSQITVDDDTAINWVFSSSGSGTVMNQSRYLDLNYDSVSLSASSQSLNFSNRNNGAYQIFRQNRHSTYYLYYYNSYFFGSSWSASTTSNNVYLFKYTGTTGGTDAVYYRISGQRTFTVPTGTSAEDALNMVKAGIDVYKYTGSKPGSGENGTLVDDSDVTWTLSTNYDSNTAGEYTVTITKDGKTLGTATVIIPEVAVKSDTVVPNYGTVYKGSAQSIQVGASIRVELEDNTSFTVPVTVSMLSRNGSAVSTGAVGTYEGLTLTYNNQVISEDFTLYVIAKASNDFPEYPNEGSVKVNKTATGVDFQESGIAKVELSASGVPSKRGADVIVMLDLSSSMSTKVDGVSRLNVLKESLASLLTQLQTPGEDGTPQDIRIAVADFNGYYRRDTDTTSPYYYETTDKLKGTTVRGSTSTDNKIYTGDGTLGAGAFVDVNTLTSTSFSSLTAASGTNYDYAFDAIYQLGSAITANNANNGVERDLFVIFMSDGAPFQFNYFTCQTGKTNSTYWNNWLTGTVTSDMFDDNARNDYYNEDGKHWMAEAIKGDTSKTYKVIRKNDEADTDHDNWIEVNGLGAKMYSIGFCLEDDQEITVATMDTVIQNIATDSSYYYRADSADDLKDTFTSIGHDINYAATNARFVDQMGANFNLQMATVEYEVVENGSVVSRTLVPQIQIIAYDIYTRQDYQNGTITDLDQIGTRKGTSTVIETVTFTQDANGTITGAYSDQVGNGETNILADGTKDGYVKGVIYAKNFLYNTNTTDVTISVVSIPESVSSTGITSGSGQTLPAESFYWNMGTVNKQELALSYYVYLDGSMEGTREAGSYDTNTFARLYYDNYLGNPCCKETVSPKMAWKEANVSYAFYLVDENGNVIVNQTTGETGSFANKIAVTNPVVYQTVLLNSTEEIAALSVASRDVLPEGYTLFDNTAVYDVRINSNSTGSWNIKSDNAKATTYVTQYSSSSTDFSNAATENAIGNDYTHTVVWFAVVWKVQALPDTVVIDYGLPVDINVLQNDMFGENGTLSAVGPLSDDLKYGVALAENFGESYVGSYGTASVNGNNVRYTLQSMSMDSYEKFAYAVRYVADRNAGYYYNTVTVIPATTVYYEDSFVTYSSKTWDDSTNDWVAHSGGEHALWTFQKNADAVQAEDRPGKFTLYDANNIYGYDGAYSAQNAYSLNGYAKATVDYDNSAFAAFDFSGTGFDVISMTSNTTGTIYVRVYEKNNSGVYNTADALKSFAVDTYYGYEYTLCDVHYTYDDGQWVRHVDGKSDATEEKKVTLPETAEQDQRVDGAVEYAYIVAADSADALYQVPVMKISGLNYGAYHAEIQVIYDPFFDHTDDGNESYVFYLDAIRVYDPANNGENDDDTVIEDAYKADGEGWPAFTELRNHLLKAESFDDVANSVANEKIVGAVFIDGNDSVSDGKIEDYRNYGPNNEVYLAPGQKVAFILDLSDYTDDSGKSIVAGVHVGVKSADGNPVNYTIANIAQAENSEENVKAGTIYGTKTGTLNTTSELYYDITGWKNDIIVITNSGNSGVISITNLKITFTQKPASVDTASVLYMTPAAAGYAVKPLNSQPVVEPTVPEETLPDPTEPEEKADVFVPGTFRVLAADSGKVGGKVVVTVITSDDVSALSVGGVTASRYTQSRWTKTRTWVVTLRADAVGTMDIETVAYNADGIASESVVKTVTVNEKTGGFLDNLFGWIFR